MSISKRKKDFLYKLLCILLNILLGGKVHNVRKYLPFNVYDFYGYLFPGIILLLFTTLFFVWYSPLSFNQIVTFLEELERVHVLLGVLGTMACIVLVYLAGHVNGTLSNLLFEQTILKRVIDYPIYGLLNIKHRICRFRRAFNFYMLFFANLLIIMPMIKIAIPDFRGFPYIYISLLAVIFIVVFLRIAIGVLGGPDHILQKREHSGHCKFFKYLIQKITQIINWFFCSSFSFSQRLSLPLIQTFTAGDRLSDSVVRKFKHNLHQLSHLDSETIGSDNFWIPYIYMHRNEPEVEEHLSNWMNLYAFLKNLSFVGFFLCFEISLAITLHYCHVVKLNHVSEQQDILINLVGFAFFYLTAWILAFRYWNIYKNYFTKYLIRSFSSLDVSVLSQWEDVVEPNITTEYKAEVESTPILRQRSKRSYGSRNG